MNVFRLTSMCAGTALATLTLPLPKADQSKPAPPEVSEAAPVRFQTSPPVARADVGAAKPAMPRVDVNGGWSATEQRIERDVETYRSETAQQLESMALAITGLSNRCERSDLATRSYLRTRVQALREHVDFARQELMQLPSSQSEENFTAAHANFYRTLTSLQGAFTQAADEVSSDR